MKLGSGSEGTEALYVPEKRQMDDRDGNLKKCLKGNFYLLKLIIKAIKALKIYLHFKWSRSIIWLLLSSFVYQ